MKILVVAAHPDDELLGLGGSLLRHRAQGDDLFVYIACAGTNLRYGRDATNELLRASRAVAERLGASLTLGELPDQGLDTVSLVNIISPIERLIQENGPELLYIHHGGDANRDHRLLAEAALIAARPPSAPSIRRILAFETPSSTEWNAGIAAAFEPTRFMDITSTIDEKLEAFAVYASEVRPSPHPRSLPALRSRAAYWGSAVGIACAEPFVVIRELE